jgi:hypothetical protein
MYTLAQNHPTPLSLEEVNANFAQWRSTRTKKSKIPDILWQQALVLLSKYSASKICKALNLSSGQLNKKIQQSTTNATANRTSKFVAINIPQTVEAVEPYYIGKIEIKRVDGATIFIEQLNQNVLTQILTQFMQGL